MEIRNIIDAKKKLEELLDKEKLEEKDNEEIEKILKEFKPFVDCAIDGWYAARPEIKKILI